MFEARSICSIFVAAAVIFSAALSASIAEAKPATKNTAKVHSAKSGNIIMLSLNELMKLKPSTRGKYIMAIREFLVNVEAKNKIEYANAASPVSNLVFYKELLYSVASAENFTNPKDAKLCLYGGNQADWDKLCNLRDENKCRTEDDKEGVQCNPLFFGLTKAGDYLCAALNLQDSRLRQQPTRNCDLMSLKLYPKITDLASEYERILKITSRTDIKAWQSVFDFTTQYCVDPKRANGHYYPPSIPGEKKGATPTDCDILRKRIELLDPELKKVVIAKPPPPPAPPAVTPPASEAPGAACYFKGENGKELAVAGHVNQSRSGVSYLSDPKIYSIDEQKTPHNVETSYTYNDEMSGDCVRTDDTKEVNCGYAFQKDGKSIYFNYSDSSWNCQDRTEVSKDVCSYLDLADPKDPSKKIDLKIHSTYWADGSVHELSAPMTRDGKPITDDSAYKMSTNVDRAKCSSYKECIAINNSVTGDQYIFAKSDKSSSCSLLETIKKEVVVKNTEHICTNLEDGYEFCHGYDGDKSTNENRPFVKVVVRRFRDFHDKVDTVVCTSANAKGPYTIPIHYGDFNSHAPVIDEADGTDYHKRGLKNAPPPVVINGDRKVAHKLDTIHTPLYWLANYAGHETIFIPTGHATYVDEKTGKTVKSKDKIKIGRHKEGKEHNLCTFQFENNEAQGPKKKLVSAAGQSALEVGLPGAKNGSK
jgi:hypothetical protein